MPNASLTFMRPKSLAENWVNRCNRGWFATHFFGRFIGTFMTPVCVVVVIDAHAWNPGTLGI